MALLPAIPAAQTRRTLAVGRPLQRELAADQIHEYEIDAAAGDFMAISVLKHGADAVSVLIGPNGQEIARAHGHASPYRDEVITAIAATTGTYILEVRPGSRRRGRYTIEFNELRPTHDGDRSRIEAESTLERALALESAGRREDYLEATPLFAAALARFRELGDRRGAAKALVGLASSEDYLTRPGALDTARAADRAARDLDDTALRAVAVDILGVEFIRAGDLGQALAYSEQAIGLAQVAGDTWEEAAAINNAGSIYGRRGEAEQAVKQFLRALALTRAGGYGRVEMNVLNNLGIAYQDLGEFEKSLDAYTQALTLARMLRDRARQALVLNNQGNLERMLGRYQDSLVHHLEALALSREAGSRENESRSLNTLSGTYYALGRYADALDCGRQALAIRRETADVYGQGTSLREIGRALVKLGDAEAAIPLLQESLAILRRIEESPGQIATLGELASAERSHANIQAAVDYARAAIEIEETLRTRVTSPALRGSFAALQHDKYELLIDLLQQQHGSDPSAGHDLEALRVAERVRARVLLESLVDSRVDLRQGIEPALLDRERALQKQLNDASAELTRALSVRMPDGSRTDAASKKVEQLTNDYQQVEAEIRQTSPAYAALTQPAPLTADDIQRAVLDDDTVLLEFALGDERSWLWAVTTTEMTSVALPRRAMIEAAARKAYKSFVAHQRRPTESAATFEARVRNADADLVRTGRALSRMLFGGIANRLNGDWRRKRLVIVADGALEYLPFAALPAPTTADRRSSAATIPRSDAPLVAQHEIVLVPSATVLAALRREAAERTPAPHAVALFADPVFDSADPRVMSASQSSSRPPTRIQLRSIERIAGHERSGVSRLPFSREEAEAIASLAPPAEVFKATDFQASRATALNGRLTRYRIVHFATHGVVDSTRPALSGLILSLVDRHGASQNGYLRLPDIYNMRLDADLVVLSACQTALGKEIKGEGLVGLARAFMYAGTPRLVASLWEVNDLATAELMKKFYRGMLRDQLRPAAALRAAQLEMSRDPRWSSPYYWAAFLLEGDWK